MPSPTQVVGLVGAVGCVIWLFVRVGRDEAVERMGIDEADWKIKRARVAKNMTQRPEWEKRLQAYWRLGNQKLNGRS